MQPEGLPKLNTPITLPEIESAIFRLAAQCINQLRHSQTVYNRNTHPEIPEI